MVLSLHVFVFLAVPTSHAFLSLDQTRCLTAITTEGHRFLNAKLTVIRSCKDADFKESGACPAPDPVLLDAIDDRLARELDQRCTISPADLGDMGFPGLCWDPNPADGFTTEELKTCMQTTHQATVDAIVPVLYDPAITGTLPFADLHCQKTVARRGAEFAAAVLRAVQKCRTAILRGKLVGIEPERCATDHPPTQKTIARAERKLRHHIDGRCTDEQAVRLDLCDPNASTAQGAAECVHDAMRRLIADPDECDLTDVEYADVPPSACRFCPVPVPAPPQPGSCPTSVELTAEGSTTDLDIGFTGLQHNQSVPTNGRLTLTVSGCAGASQPGCGQCDLSGPIANAGGVAFDTHRCEDEPWVPCSTDSDCTNAGATGPCIYLLLGAPLPLVAGGVPTCVLTAINGAVTGTINIDDGSASTAMRVIAKVHAQGTFEQPCPRCVDGICDGGPRTGEACTVNGTGVFGDVSLDCPPSPGTNAGNVGINLVSSTGTQTVTISTANPTCHQAGYASKRCLCDTCNNANGEVCMTNADCPPSGGNPGVCGGRRCLGGTNAGAPCGASSECPGGGGCYRPGEATQPNSCEYDDSTVPGDGTLCVDSAPVGDNEGECPQLPVDMTCSIETFRACIDDADCTPGVSCPNCLPGQTCLTNGTHRPCFLNNGVIGGSDSVTGVADPGCGSSAHPVLGAFFCAPPVGSPAVNASTGLPGLARVRVPLTAVLKP